MKTNIPEFKEIFLGKSTQEYSILIKDNSLGV